MRLSHHNDFDDIKISFNSLRIMTFRPEMEESKFIVTIKEMMQQNCKNVAFYKVIEDTGEKMFYQFKVSGRISKLNLKFLPHVLLDAMDSVFPCPGCFMKCFSSFL